MHARWMFGTAVALGFLAAGPGPAQAPPHNIVVIVTDDMPWHELEVMPHTNALIGDRGVRFTKAFASTALCCPSRVTIFTGLHARHHFVFNNHAPLGGATLFDDASTVATWVDDAGYRTGLFGKYMNEYGAIRSSSGPVLVPAAPIDEREDAELEDEELDASEPLAGGPNAMAPYVPPGWDVWRLVGAGYYNYNLVTNDGRVFQDSTGAESYSTNVLKDELIEFIETTPTAVRLFAYFAPTAPHAPAQTTPEFDGTFADYPAWRPPSYNEANVSDKPSWLADNDLLTQNRRDKTDEFYRDQLETLQPLDEAIVEIIDALDRTGRLANTAIVFTSDHGFELGEHRDLGKNCVYDPCMRLPFLVRAPGAVPRTDASLISLTDLAPTIAEWAGTTPDYAVDGRSFAGLLRDPSVPWRSAVLSEALGQDPVSASNPRNFQAVRTARFLYSELMGGDRELYDLAVDPDHLENVVNDPDYAANVNDLKDRLKSFRDVSKLGVTMTPSASHVSRGSNVTYTIRVSNATARPLASVIVGVTLPSSLSFVSCTPSGEGVCEGSLTGRKIGYRVMAKNSARTITIVATVKSNVAPGTVISNTASVNSFTSREATPANNSATATITAD